LVHFTFLDVTWGPYLKALKVSNVVLGFWNCLLWLGAIPATLGVDS